MFSSAPWKTEVLLPWRRAPLKNSRSGEQQPEKLGCRQLTVWQMAQPSDWWQPTIWSHLEKSAAIWWVQMQHLPGASASASSWSIVHSYLFLYSKPAVSKYRGKIVANNVVLLLLLSLLLLLLINCWLLKTQDPSVFEVIARMYVLDFYLIFLYILLIFSSVPSSIFNT